MAPDARKQDVAADEHQERCQALMDVGVKVNDEDAPRASYQFALGNLW